MSNSILYRLFPGDLGSDFEEVGLSGAAMLQHRSCHCVFRQLPQGSGLGARDEGVKPCSDFGNRNPAFGLFGGVMLIELPKLRPRPALSSIVLVVVLVLDFFRREQMQPVGAFVHRFLSPQIAFSRQRS